LNDIIYLFQTYHKHSNSNESERNVGSNIRAKSLILLTEYLFCCVLEDRK